MKNTRTLSILLTSLLLCALPAFAESPVQWDDEASADLAMALHEMHEVWNSGDIESLKKLIIGDDVLVTFELDPETHAPIRLNSKDDMWQFVDKIVQNLDDEDAVSLLGHPGVHCRATDSFGICTEECNVTVKLGNGKEERHKLWSTATAVKAADGWKWIQWHMSTGGPTEVYQDGVKVASE
ncbi:MAG: nuclear transport factor 2 family protein [Acidobacteriota bacterium]